MAGSRAEGVPEPLQLAGMGSPWWERGEQSTQLVSPPEHAGGLLGSQLWGQERGGAAELTAGGP